MQMSFQRLAIASAASTCLASAALMLHLSGFIL